jgi:hypothetical protein
VLEEFEILVDLVLVEVITLEGLGRTIGGTGFRGTVLFLCALGCYKFERFTIELKDCVGWYWCWFDDD